MTTLEIRNAIANLLSRAISSAISFTEIEEVYHVASAANTAVRERYGDADSVPVEEWIATKDLTTACLLMGKAGADPMSSAVLAAAKRLARTDWNVEEVDGVPNKYYRSFGSLRKAALSEIQSDIIRSL